MKKKSGNKKKRILALSPFFDNSCGVGTVARSLGEELRKKGNIVDELEYRPWKDTDKYTLSIGGKKTTFNSSQEVVDFFKSRGSNYDVLHFHNQVFANGLNENLFRHFKDTPKLQQIHSVTPYDQEVLGDKSHQDHRELQRQNRMMNKVDRVIHLTPEVKEIAEKHYGVEHAKDSKVIYNSAKLPTLNQGIVKSLKRKLSRNGQKKVILYAGRLSEEKGILELAEGFREARANNEDIKLVICGDNKSNPNIKKTLKEKLGDLVEGVDYTFEGRVTQKRLADYYAAADFFIQPSRYEHFSISAIEAFSHKKPVIMTKMDSVKKTFKFDTDEHYVVSIDEINSPESIAKAINNAVNTDQASLEKMTERAFDFYQNSLTPEKVTAQFEEEYDSLIAGKKGINSKNHAYIVPTDSDRGLEKTIDSVLAHRKDTEEVIVSTYDGHKISAEMKKKYSGKVKFLESEKKITKYKSNALNKGVSESTKSGVKSVSIVLPGYKINENHPLQQEDLDEETFITHSSTDDETYVKSDFKSSNPVNQNTTAYRADLFDKVGFFYDVMNYAEDMDFYEKTTNSLGHKSIKNTKRKVGESK